MLLLLCLGWLVASADGAGAALPDSPQDLDQLIAAAGGAAVLLSALIERLGLSAIIVALGGATVLLPAFVERLGLSSVLAMLRQASEAATPVPIPWTECTRDHALNRTFY